jgi:hypothetical protein
MRAYDAVGKHRERVYAAGVSVRMMGVGRPSRHNYCKCRLLRLCAT